LPSFIFNESLHHGPVAAHFAEQVIEQGCFPQRTYEQLLGGMRFSAYLPHHRFDGESEPALRAELGTFLFRFVRFIQVDSAIGTTYQVVVDVCAAITAFGFIVRG
jgi:hypothetical protein